MCWVFQISVFKVHCLSLPLVQINGLTIWFHRPKAPAKSCWYPQRTTVINHTDSTYRPSDVGYYCFNVTSPTRSFHHKLTVVLDASIETFFTHTAVTSHRLLPNILKIYNFFSWQKKINVQIVLFQCQTRGSFRSFTRRQRFQIDRRLGGGEEEAGFFFPPDPGKKALLIDGRGTAAI